ncbi:MAG: 4-hydroxy-tetrahydrodipicolinate synthase [Sulfolobales archaeon]|nr:4-hydroxy-tetrahydrodipicolinate synthase [Sulfolobales archaeon]MDW7969442.1 4-hydroxy-tetrahydrodipicolinate synthase [Sulfolobales archaeon]
MRLSKETLNGVIVAIVTPFKDDYELDLEGLRTLTNYLVYKGVHGIMTPGGNGEFPHLLPDERIKVVETVRESTPSHVSVIACVSACGLKEALTYVKHAADVGADGIISTPPYYYKLPHESLFEFFRTLSEKSEIPVIVYNNPSYTGHNITPQLMAKIASLNNVIGMKQSNSDIGQTSEIIRLVGHKISVLTGIDSQFFPTLCIGGRGIFSTAACVVPRHMVKLYEEFTGGNYRKAFEIHVKLQELFKFFEYEPGYVAPCKEALRMLNLPAGPVRKPLPSLSREEVEELKHVLTKLELTSTQEA